MMKPLNEDHDCVRVECLGCGAHTQIGWDDYESALDLRRSVMCSTCGTLHRVIGARARRSPLYVDEPATARPPQVQALR